MHYIEQFKAAQTVEEQSEVIEKINAHRNTFQHKANLVYIRASIDTNDEFYQKERDYFDEIAPMAEEIVFEYYQALVNSPFRAATRRKMGYTAICISRKSN